MSITIDLAADELAMIKKLTRLENDAEAVRKAAREFLRLRRLQELKSTSGLVEFDDNWRELEAMEMGEMEFPK